MPDEHVAIEKYHHGGVTVIDCETCGFKHQQPIPTLQEVRERYEKEFGGERKSDFQENKKEDEAYWRRSFERRRRTYRELLDSPDEPRILDVGCGTGDLLSFFKNRGWSVQGIEPSQNFHDLLEDREIPNLPKLTMDMTPEDWASLGSFDVINLSMVLEHIRDPRGLVETLADRGLRPGGVLTVEVPNEFNLLQETATEAHNLDQWWIHDLHINYFDFPSLERLIEASGLQPTIREAQFPLEMFLLFGDVYVGDDDLGREIHQKRAVFERVLHESGRTDELMGIYRALADSGLGRTAIVHAQKE